MASRGVTPSRLVAARVRPAGNNTARLGLRRNPKRAGSGPVVGRFTTGLDGRRAGRGLATVEADAAKQVPKTMGRKTHARLWSLQE